MPTWTEDEAGPFRTVPYPGRHWRVHTHPAQYPHEYIRNGTAKQLTLFHPATGRVRVKGVLRTTNAILHPWIKHELEDILAELPQPMEGLDPVENRRQWERWQEGLTICVALPEQPPQLRMLLVLDNLSGHKTPELVQWLVEHGIMPLYTPLGGSWLNLTESVQGVIKSRALTGEHPQTSAQIIEWIEAAARGWNRQPTPFKWDGKRRARRDRARARRHPLAGSAGYTDRVVRRRAA